jgi:hypothetical protein
MNAMHCWFMELTDGTRFQFLCQEDDGVTNPLTSISGFDQGDYWAVQGPLGVMGSGGGPLASGQDHHPLASGISAQDDCWAIQKENVADIFSAPML